MGILDYSELKDYVRIDYIERDYPGEGNIMLKQLIKKFPNRKILAVVSSKNEKALKFFEKHKFKIEETDGDIFYLTFKRKSGRRRQ